MTYWQERVNELQGYQEEAKFSINTRRFINPLASSCNKIAFDIFICEEVKIQINIS